MVIGYSDDPFVNGAVQGVFGSSRSAIPEDWQIGPLLPEAISFEANRVHGLLNWETSIAHWFAFAIYVLVWIVSLVTHQRRKSKLPGHPIADKLQP